MLLKEIHLKHPNLSKLRISTEPERFNNYKFINKKIYNNSHGFDSVFENQTRCVCAHIEKNWKPKVKWDFWKIVIYCFDENETIEIRDQSNVGILNIGCRFNYKDFFSLSNLEKKILVLDFLETNITNVLEQNNLATEGFKNACAKVRKDKFIYKWIWGKKRNAEGAIAEILAIHDVLGFELYLIVKDKKKTMLVNKHIETEVPNEFMFISLKGSLEWINTDKVVYLTERGWKYTLDTTKENEVVKEIGTSYYYDEFYNERTRLALTALNSTPETATYIDTD